MKNEMRLQGIGLVEGTPAGELKVGDIIRWNYGSIGRVISVQLSATGKTIEVTTEYYHNGKTDTYTWKRRSSSLVNIIGGGNTVLTSEYAFEVVTEETPSQEEEATEKTNEWVWTAKTESMKPDRKAGEAVPTEHLREGASEYTPYKSWIEKGYVEKKGSTEEAASLVTEPRKRTAVRKYNCECGCNQEIGKGTEYYQVGPKGTDYKLVHHKCIEKVKLIS